ncbi:hypothetical protein GCM10020258_51330 [Sphingomonas yabuuchiae]
MILRSPDVPLIDPATGLPPFQIVYPADFRDCSHSVIRIDIELNLVSLTIAGQRKIGVDGNALLAGPRSTYPTTRAWAEKIHTQCPGAHGIYYSSYQYGPDYAVVLFEDRLPAGAFLTSRAASSRRAHAMTTFGLWRGVCRSNMRTSDALDARFSRQIPRS